MERTTHGPPYVGYSPLAPIAENVLVVVVWCDAVFTRQWPSRWWNSGNDSRTQLRRRRRHCVCETCVSRLPRWTTQQLCV